MDGMPSITGGASTSGAQNGNFSVGDFGGIAGMPPPPSNTNEILLGLAGVAFLWLIFKKSK